MRYGALTAAEIREKAAQGWLAIVPTGCTEQQGPHLPVDFDTWFAEAVMLAASEQASVQFGVNALVLPALPFGPTPEHRNYGSGYIDLPVTLHHAVVRAILDSLVAQGFQNLVLWRGCGGHQLQNVVDAFNEAHKGEARVDLPDWPYHTIWCRVADPDVPGGHADSFTTSMALYLRPESVRTELIADPHNAPVNWDDPHLDFAQYSASGVIGNPTHSSAAIGEQLWTEIVQTCAEMLKDVASTLEAV